MDVFCRLLEVGCPALRDLQCNIGEAPQGRLIGLEQLTIDGRGQLFEYIVGLSPLTRLHSMLHLSSDYAKLSSPLPGGAFVALHSVYMGAGGELIDLSSICRFTALEELCIDDGLNEYQSFAPLASLTRLRTLNMPWASPFQEDVEAMRALTSLTSLNIHSLNYDGSDPDYEAEGNLEDDRTPFGFPTSMVRLTLKHMPDPGVVLCLPSSIREIHVVDAKASWCTVMYGSNERLAEVARFLGERLYHPLTEISLNRDCKGNIFVPKMIKALSPLGANVDTFKMSHDEDDDTGTDVDLEILAEVVLTFPLLRVLILGGYISIDAEAWDALQGAVHLQEIYIKYDMDVTVSAALQTFAETRGISIALC